MFKELENYLTNWFNIENIKPKNEPVFIQEFIKFISPENFENLQFSFDGDGSYFGKQITVSIFNNWNSGYLLQFEICYDYKKISVYNANHNGFWTPEFIDIEKNNGNFSKLQTKLSKLLFHFFGINHLISA